MKTADVKARVEKSTFGYRIFLETVVTDDSFHPPMVTLPMEYGPGDGFVLFGWWRPTRKAAKRKARREIDRYRASLNRPETFEVTA